MKLTIEIDEARFKDIQRIAEVQLEMSHFQTAEQIIAKGVPLEQEPCTDAINRQAVLNLPRTKIHNQWGNVIKKCVDVEDIRRLSSVNSQEPKAGRWIGTDEWYHKCSECEEVSHFRWYEGYIYKWCPYCGAEMKEGD